MQVLSDPVGSERRPGAVVNVKVGRLVNLWSQLPRKTSSQVLLFKVTHYLGKHRHACAKPKATKMFPVC